MNAAMTVSPTSSAAVLPVRGRLGARLPYTRRWASLERLLYPVIGLPSRLAPVARVGFGCLLAPFAGRVPLRRVSGRPEPVPLRRSVLLIVDVRVSLE